MRVLIKGQEIVFTWRTQELLMKTKNVNRGSESALTMAEKLLIEAVRMLVGA